MSMPAESAPLPWRDSVRPAARLDIAVALALFLATTLYCASLSYNMYTYDEGFFLYEAKRVLDGQVFYRDIFDIITPGAMYVMAAAYALFGTTMTTARTTMAVLHGLIAVLSFAACRTLAVRRSIAAVVGLAQVAVWFPAFERAAPHWFGTFFCVSLLLFLLRRPLINAPRALVAGLLAGALVLIQQQRGVAMLWAPAAVVLLDHRLLGGPTGWRTLVRHLAAYAAGVALVVVPVMLTLVLLAGFEPIFGALVRYPLSNYRRINPLPWWAYGSHNPFFDAYVGPIVKYLSLFAVGSAAVRAVLQRRDRRSAAARRPLLVALVISLGALLGIQYYAMFPYVALVAPVWIVLIGDFCETALAHLEQRWRAAPIVAAALLAGLSLIFALRIEKRSRERHAAWPYERDTPYGRMNFSRKEDMALLDVLDRLTSEAPNRELFIYPWDSGLYLMTGTENPTRFQVMIPQYSDPEHMQEVVDVLEARRVPLVIRGSLWLKKNEDPILPYLQQHYEQVKLPHPKVHLLQVYRRKPEPKR